MALLIKGEIECYHCETRASVDLSVKPFGHDRDCLFILSPSPYAPPDGWHVYEGYYYCPAHTEDYESAKARPW